MRLILGLVAGAAVAALGAVILGEYTFSGPAVLASGVVFGLFVAEAGLAAGGHTGLAARGRSRRPPPAFAAACGTIAGLGMVWAAWISTGHDLDFLDPEGWVAVVLAAVTAAVRVLWTRRARDSSRREPAPAE